MRFSGLIEPDDVREMLAWDNVDSRWTPRCASRRKIAPRLERLLRYCARLLHVRFVQHCCRWQPKGGCLFMAGSCLSGDTPRASVLGHIPASGQGPAESPVATHACFASFETERQGSTHCRLSG